MLRVVVSGLGLVSPVGCSVPVGWTRVASGTSAVRPLAASTPGFAEADLAGKIAAMVATESTDGSHFVEAPKDAHHARFVRFALAAASQAVADARLERVLATHIGGDQCGVSIGTAVGGIDQLLGGYDTLRERGARRVSPRLIPSLLPNTAAGEVAIRFGLRGPCLSAATACAASAHSIGDAFRAIQRGDARLMLAGGAEACINRLVFAGFGQARALSTRFVDAPATASRPFDVDRDGFVLGEGAAVLVLEELGHARARGATIYAELVGYGASADAFHSVAPLTCGSGAARAVAAALRDARLEAGAVDYVNAHATSTPLGDAAELRALDSIFGESTASRPTPLLVSSTKGATAHMLGAAGAVEALLTVLALHHGQVPPTANLARSEEHATVESLTQIQELAAQTPAGRRALALVRGDAALGVRPRVALTNSFGFGGTNAALLLRAMDKADVERAR